MQDASDFPTEANGGPDIVLILVYVAAALGLWFCGYLIGKVSESRRADQEHRRAAEDIHAAIAQWADATVKLPPTSLPLDYVRALLGEIKGRIGPAQSLASETSKRVKALQDLIDGKPEKPADKPAVAGAESTVLYPALIPAGGREQDRPILTSGFVAQKGPVLESKPAEGAQTPPSMEEQQMRLHLEASKFRAYWCGSPGVREDRIRELVAAQKALCHTKPFVPLRFDVGHKNGH
jgi:hypothetical protein